MLTRSCIYSTAAYFRPAESDVDGIGARKEREPAKKAQQKRPRASPHALNCARRPDAWATLAKIKLEIIEGDALLHSVWG